jgi:hypothetical protein
MMVAMARAATTSDVVNAIVACVQELEKYHAFEGGRQIMANLAVYVTETHRTGAGS